MKIPKTTLEQWRVLEAVIAYGSFAQAAEHLHRSQSAISYTVKKLQEQLNIELLEIEGRKAKLTPCGEALLRRAKEITQSFLSLEEMALRLHQTGWETEIKLAVDAAFPNHLLLKVLKEFLPEGRETRIQLRETVLSGGEEALLKQEVDLAITPIVPIGFLGEHLLEIDLIAVAHYQHPLHHLGRELTLDDLRNNLQIVTRDSGQLRPRDIGWLGSDQRWTVTSPEKALAILKEGLGFTWIPSSIAKELLQHGELKILPLADGKMRKFSLYLVTRQPELAGPATKYLAQLFKQSVKTRFN